MKPWMRGALAGALILAAGLWLARRGDGLHSAVNSALAWVRAAGPRTFFLLMAIVPAPLAWFTIPAGEAFTAQLTLAGVVAAALGAVAVQIVWCYWLARCGLRPWIYRWLTRRGQVVPVVARSNALATVLIVRLIPGPPLPLQCLLLGLAEVPFGVYFIASWLLTVPWVVGGVVLGRGLLHGNLATGLAGASLLAACLVAARIARRRWAAPPPA